MREDMCTTMTTQKQIDIVFKETVQRCCRHILSCHDSFDVTAVV